MEGKIRERGVKRRESWKAASWERNSGRVRVERRVREQETRESEMRVREHETRESDIDCNKLVNQDVSLN